MSVTDKAGRVKKGERCIALDEDAQRCRRAATVAIQYHGEHYLHYTATWVRAAFCDKHAEDAP